MVLWKVNFTSFASKIYCLFLSVLVLYRIYTRMNVNLNTKFNLINHIIITYFMLEKEVCKAGISFFGIKYVHIKHLKIIVASV